MLEFIPSECVARCYLPLMLYGSRIFLVGGDGRLLSIGFYTHVMILQRGRSEHVSLLFLHAVSHCPLLRMRPGTHPSYTDNEYNVFTRCFEVQYIIITSISVFIQNTIRTHTTV